MHNTGFNPNEDDVKYEDHLNLEDQFNLNYNSDLSGSISITYYELGVTVKQHIEIPGWMLIEFVGNFIKSEKVGQLESMSGREFLDATIQS